MLTISSGAQRRERRNQKKKRKSRKECNEWPVRGCLHSSSPVFSS